MASKRSTSTTRSAPRPAPTAGLAVIDAEALWGGVPTASFVVDADMRFVAANAAAEQLFSQSAYTLRKMSLSDFFRSDSRVFTIIRGALGEALSVTEYAVEISWRDGVTRRADLVAAEMPEHPGHVMITLHPRSVAEAMDQSIAQQSTVRSITGLAAALAHEVKNALSGISGAAQLMEMTADDGDQDLLNLIHEEVDKIKALLERVDHFGAPPPERREPVNLHYVLDQAKRSAAVGFARHLRIREAFDPSLPNTPGDKQLLSQLFSNLLKNAAEAAPAQGGEILVQTAFRPGVKLVVAGGRTQSLPLEISVTDNGPGIPEELRPHIFEPFITSKSSGTGLGLALAAKIVDDHGGVIECQSRPGRTTFRVRLPVWRDDAAAAAKPHETN